MQSLFATMVYVEKTTFDTGRNSNLDETYRNIIKPAILKAGRKSIRADEALRPGLEGERDGDDQVQISGFEISTCVLRAPHPIDK